MKNDLIEILWIGIEAARQERKERNQMIRKIQVLLEQRREGERWAREQPGWQGA